MTKNVNPSSEKDAASQAGLTVRVYRLQRELSRLPILPNKERLRRERDRVSKELIQAAREDRCLTKITPWASTNFPGKS